MRYLCVLGGGAAGSLLRYVAGLAISSRWTGRFPLATFLINVAGSFAIGVLATLLSDTNWRPLLITGFLGGFTTFSAFEWESFSAINGGEAGIAAFYIGASVGAGYIACRLGAMLGAMFAGSTVRG